MSGVLSRVSHDSTNVHPSRPPRKRAVSVCRTESNCHPRAGLRASDKLRRCRGRPEPHHGRRARCDAHNGVQARRRRTVHHETSHAAPPRGMGRVRAPFEPRSGSPRLVPLATRPATHLQRAIDPLATVRRRRPAASKRLATAKGVPDRHLQRVQSDLQLTRTRLQVALATRMVSA